MESKDTTTKEESDKEGQPIEFLNRSAKALKLAKLYFDKAKIVAKKTTDYVQKIQNSHQSVELIASVLQKQIHDAEELHRQTTTQWSTLAQDVDKLFDSDSDIMKKLYKSLSVLKKKKIHPTLYQNVPPSIPESERTYTLYDWVGIEELNERRNEALQEMAELQKLSSYLRDNIRKMQAKYEYVASNSRDVLTNATSDHRLPDTDEKLEIQTNELNAINALTLTIASHYDRLSFAIKNKAKSGSVDLSPFQQATAALSGQVSQIYDCLQRIEAIFHEFENRSKKYDGIFLQCQSVTDLLDKFGQSNKTIAQELKYLEDQFKQHKAGYLPLFADLKKLSMFYQMFAVSYHEMLFEIARRRSEFARMQEIVQKYQAELDAVHQRELNSREHFYQFWGQYLPSSLCPQLVEPPPQLKIVPDTLNTELPDVGEISRSSTQHIDRTLTRSTSVSSHEGPAEQLRCDASQTNSDKILKPFPVKSSNDGVKLDASLRLLRSKQDLSASNASDSPTSMLIASNNTNSQLMSSITGGGPASLVTSQNNNAKMTQLTALADSDTTGSLTTPREIGSLSDLIVERMFSNPVPTHPSLPVPHNLNSSGDSFASLEDDDDSDVDFEKIEYMYDQPFTKQDKGPTGPGPLGTTRNNVNLFPLY
jgi:hypothetical protein